MVEGSDLNDSTILQGTTQEGGERNTVRFKFTLPSGHKIVSEWIAQDNQKKALRLWCDSVREQWVLDVNRKWIGSSAPPVEDQPRDTSRRPVDTTRDPCEHAKNQVALLEAEERHWSTELDRAKKHLASTQSALHKWKVVIETFNIQETNGESNGK